MSPDAPPPQGFSVALQVGGVEAHCKMNPHIKPPLWTFLDRPEVWRTLRGVLGSFSLRMLLSRLPPFNSFLCPRLGFRNLSAWCQDFRKPASLTSFTEAITWLGIQPSAAGDVSFDSRWTRIIRCWLVARICIFSPLATVISSSFTAV